MNTQQATHFEKQLAELNNVMQSLVAQDSFEDLIRVIHKPGWTTIAEVELFAGLVEHMTSQARSLAALKRVLISGASKVELNPQPLPPKQ
jgi:hypothetical protein